MRPGFFHTKVTEFVPVIQHVNKGSPIGETKQTELGVVTERFGSSQQSRALSLPFHVRLFSHESDNPGTKLKEDLYQVHRGTSLIRNTSLLGPYLGSYGGPSGGGLFLVSEVPL